jgi:DNA-binding response OmpR family regulator
MPDILLIDDNEELQSLNLSHLTAQGFSVTCAYTGIKAIACLNERRYDCIVLDILLPDLDGYAICKAARTETDTPILFLSCLNDSGDKVKGLMTGGDYYMTKPYSLKDLSMCIRALIRQSERPGIPRGELYIDSDNKVLRVCGKYVLLSAREFKLFKVLYENQDTMFSKEALLEAVWHNKADAGVVAVMILKLRRKIEFAECIIGSVENTYGTGYRFVPPKMEAEK